MAAIACGMDSGMFSVPSCVCRLECRPHAAISGPWSCWSAANLLDKEAIEEATRQRCFHVFKNVQEGGIKIDPDPMMALAKTAKRRRDFKVKGFDLQTKGNAKLVQYLNETNTFFSTKFIKETKI